jgi:hypothetical protein
MTTPNPITPPPELVRAWASLVEQHGIADVFAAAAQWGADQELEACCDALDGINPDKYWSQRLRAARRPKPASLKEQALRELQMAYDTSDISMVHLDTIRRALEALPDD